jgi:single-strand DNA-binding protein
MCMSAQTKGQQVTTEETVNEVRLLGKVSQDPELRTLPSGDPLWTFRVVIPRSGSATAGRSGVDALDCSVWSGRARRTVATWRAGDLVEVTGAVRRRFFRAGGAAVSRVEVEVASARVIRRRASA